MYWTKIGDVCYLANCVDCEVRLELDEGQWHFCLLPNGQHPAMVEGSFHPSWDLDKCKLMVEAICDRYAR
jgi:hypothetical protein